MDFKSMLWSLFILINYAFHFTTAFFSFSQSIEEKLNVSGLIKYWGYPLEEHTVTTKDGYILQLQRIPRGKHEKNRHILERRPVVFLQHGLLASSSNWVTNLPHQSLGFILADAGYDVWLGNVRGNTYSRKHVRYSVRDENYWDFTWDEMAMYDLPSMINYALEVSGQKKLYYVGHSQGTAIGFARFSEDLQLASKVKLFIALAPVGRIDRCKSPIRYAAYVTRGLEFLFDIFGVKEFLPSSRYTKFLAERACPLDEPGCGNILFLLAGPDTKNLNKTRIPIYFSHTPAGTSVRNMVHYAQIYLAKKFQAYDFGYFKNLLKYGSLSPKVYNVKTCTTPVLAFSGGKDWLADPKDVSWLLKQVPHLVQHNYLADYNHMDFIWGMDAQKRVYQDIIKAIQKYEQRV